MGLSLALAASLASAGEITANDPELARQGWREFTFNGIEPAAFRHGLEGAIEVRSKNGASMLFKEIPASEEAVSTFRWRWRVDTAVPATDLSMVGKDDRNLALHVWFPETGGGGLFSSLSRALSKAVGSPFTGKGISYIFGGKGERGQRLANPFRKEDAVYVILRPSGTATGQWFDEQVDLSGDYQRAFGKPAPRPSHLAISSDSDDTHTESAGLVSEIRFSR